MLSELRFLSCVVHVAFADAADLRAVRNVALQSPEDSLFSRELSISIPESQDDRVVLRSRTGGSQVQITPFAAAMQTTYFDAYEEARADAGRRAAYGVAKLGALLDLTDRAEVALQMIGVVVTARAAAEPMDQISRVRRACSEAFRLQGALLENPDELVDFGIRIARRADEHTFSNLQVSQYEERTFQVQLPMQGMRPLHEWDGQVSTRGLELKYDRNNKLGLLVGHREWDTDFFLNLCRGTIEGAPAEFGRVVDLVRGHL